MKNDMKTASVEEVVDIRDTYIGRVVAGKSFADVGGLWGTVNEKVSVAHSSGAKQLSMIDVSALDDPLWTRFGRRCADNSLPVVEHISTDVMAYAESETGSTFDVVHCSGVLYHMPDPVRFLRALRTITGQSLILSSAVTAPRVEGEIGTFEIPPSAMVFVPALQGRDREILRSYWQGVVGDGALGLTAPQSSWDPEDFGPWWWLPTSQALVGLCEAVGFYQIDGSPTWNGNAYTQLLSVRQI